MQYPYISTLAPPNSVNEEFNGTIVGLDNQSFLVEGTLLYYFDFVSQEGINEQRRKPQGK